MTNFAGLNDVPERILFGADATCFWVWSLESRVSLRVEVTFEPAAPRRCPCNLLPVRRSFVDVLDVPVGVAARTLEPTPCGSCEDAGPALRDIPNRDKQIIPKIKLIPCFFMLIPQWSLRAGNPQHYLH